MDTRTSSRRVQTNTSFVRFAEEHHHLTLIGWREWLSLPEFGINAIQAKIDTGARTSALHTSEAEIFHSHHKEYLRFAVHPLRSNPHKKVYCTAPMVDIRWVMDLGGHREKRYVIVTTVSLGGIVWPIELTLTNRAAMKYRMLLGRTAIQKGFMIIPSLSYLQGKKKDLKK